MVDVLFCKPTCPKVESVVAGYDALESVFTQKCLYSCLCTKHILTPNSSHIDAWSGLWEHWFSLVFFFFFFFL